MEIPPTDVTKTFWRTCQNSSGINKGPLSNNLHNSDVSPLSWSMFFLFLKLFPSLFQGSSDFEAHSFPELPTLTIPPAVAPPLPTLSAATPGTGGDQRRAQAFQLGAQISELNDLLHSQPSSEKELRALEHNLLLMATILRVPWVNSGVWQPRLPWRVLLPSALLQNDLSLLRCSSPAEEILALEEVLGSFDFLSQDLNTDDNTACSNGLRKPEHRWVCQQPKNTQTARSLPLLQRLFFFFFFYQMSSALSRSWKTHLWHLETVILTRLLKFIWIYAASFCRYASMGGLKYRINIEVMLYCSKFTCITV